VHERQRVGALTLCGVRTAVARRQYIPSYIAATAP
jgi:hypothetical protein